MCFTLAMLNSPTITATSMAALWSPVHALKNFTHGFMMDYYEKRVIYGVGWNKVSNTGWQVWDAVMREMWGWWEGGEKWVKGVDQGKGEHVEKELREARIRRGDEEKWLRRRGWQEDERWVCREVKSGKWGWAGSQDKEVEMRKVEER